MTGGLLADAAGLVGGLIFGSVVGAAGGSLYLGLPVALPTWLRSAIFIGIGAQVGMRVTHDALGPLKHALLPAVGAALALIAAGVLIGYVLRLTGRGPHGEVLATSPGALEVLIGLAAQYDYEAVHVAMFHLVRLLIVVLSIPLILHLVQG
jgi:membrane AbrB-like protein